MDLLPVIVSAIWTVVSYNNFELERYIITALTGLL